MELKYKSSLIIILTLLIGMILGSVITFTFMKRSRPRIDRIASLRTQHGFIERFERIVQPDGQQREQLRIILQKHFDRMQDVGAQYRIHFFSLTDSLKKDIEPILTSEQKERLEGHLKRFKEFRKRGSRDFPRLRKERMENVD